MSIQIIDNFNLSVAKPIDDRFVVGSQSLYPNVSYNDKNDIPYKYPGLRVWDLDLGVPYYWNGSSWLSENSVSITGSGSASYVPKFVGSGTSTTLGNSCIYIITNSVGINNTNPSPLYSLDVTGAINSTSLVSTNGLAIQQLNATNISTGIMSLARLANNVTSGWILTSGSSQPLYVNPSTVTVGAASASVIFNETVSSNIHYVGFFSGSTGNLQSKVSRLTSSTIDTKSRQITYQPSTGTLTSALITTGTFSSTYNTSVGANFNVVGTTTLTGNIISNVTTTGTMKISSPATSTNRLVVNGVIEFQDGVNGGGLYSNIYYSGTSFKHSVAKPGFAFFYQTYNSENKFVFYSSESGTVGSNANTNPLFKFDPADTTPQLEITNGIKVSYTSSQTRSSGSANTAQTMVFNHNLGYIPIVNWTINGGNVTNTGTSPYGSALTSITTTSVSIYIGTNTGNNATTVTVYCY